MIQNLYLILVVASRGLGLWLVARPVLGFLFAGILGLGGELPSVMSLVPSLVCGLLLWFLAKPIAALITSDLH
ncbi:MAG: hypothetical protein ABI162_11385 [Luteolibacter sp.]